MDTHTYPGANCAVDDPAMESGDWMAQPQRQRSVNKIMDNLKMHLPFSGYERLQELTKIAERVEEEIYTACEAEYTRKICFMMMTMENRLQSPTRLNSAALNNSVNPSAVLDVTVNGGVWQEEVYQKIDAMKVSFLQESTAQTDNPDVNDGQQEVYQMIEAIKDLYRIESTAQVCNQNGEDWQEEVYQKIKSMKDLYLQELKVIHLKILSKLQQYDSLPQQPKNEFHVQLKVVKKMLERFMQFLQIPKHGILADYKDKAVSYEKQIIHIVNAYRRSCFRPQNTSKRNNIGSTGLMQASSSLSFALPPSSSLHQPAMASVAGPSSSLQHISKMSSVQQNQLIGDTRMESNSGGSRKKIRRGRKRGSVDTTYTQSVGLPLESDDHWRDHVQADSRERVKNKILVSLKRHLPYKGDEGLQLQQLRKITERFEEKIYATAISQYDYTRKICLKMLSMETRPQYPMLSNSDGNSVNP